MALALIAFDFDPDLRLGPFVVGVQALALAAAVLIAVSLAAVLAGRLGAPRASVPPARAQGRNDFLLILIGVIPGAVLAARIGYVLIHLDYYTAHPGAWLNLSQGSLELGFGMAGGIAAGVAMARAVRAPVGHWLHVLAVPTMVGLGLGKFAMALGGAGQGIAAELPWATAYVGPGPWGSALPDVPSHPAQIYEGILSLVIAVLVGGLLLIGRFREPDGRAFLAAITLWALARAEVAFVWRDPEVVGPFRSAQIVALAMAAASLALFLRQTWAGRSRDAIRVDPPAAGRGGLAYGTASPPAEVASAVIATTPEPMQESTAAADATPGPVAGVPAVASAVDAASAEAAADARDQAATAGAQAAHATLEPPRRAREPWDPEVRRRMQLPTPERSGWLTAVPTTTEPPTGPTPRGAEPRTSESSSSSSS